MKTHLPDLTTTSDPDLLKQVEEIMARYPETTASENDKVIDFLKRGKMLDRGLLASNDRLAPRLAEFHRDHQRKLAIGHREYAVLAFVLLAVLALCAWLWDRGL